MNNLKEKYKKEVIAKMKETRGYTNDLAVPKLVKVVINIGLGQGLKDSKFYEMVEDTFIRISGQKPISTKAKKSISNFKIREGMVVGMKVTLRGERMYDFVEKLVNVTLPRVRDFRGVSPSSVDKLGNLSIGFKEHICFPEISAGEVERIHPLEVVINNTAKSKEEGLELFKLMGFPFKDDSK